MVDEGDGIAKTIALLLRNGGEETAIGDDALEQLGRRADLVAEGVEVGLVGDEVMRAGHP